MKEPMMAKGGAVKPMVKKMAKKGKW
jgi:hypothetical protein